MDRDSIAQRRSRVRGIASDNLAGAAVTTINPLIEQVPMTAVLDLADRS
jgi:hypothetical protein